MKIRKVDDKPMVIHTKEKAKIHAHEPKGAKIKGSNIYTVERGPKTIGAKVSDGVQGGIRPGIVVSCDASNHGGAPQISVVPLSSKLKDNPVHVIVEPSEIRGYALSNRSDFMPEDIQTLNKGCVRFKSGYIPGESEIREAMDRAMIMQLNLLPVARKMVLEELEVKQNG